MKVSFYGAAKEVTGSCHLVETQGKRILIDCGYFQGYGACDTKNYNEFGFDPKTIDAVVITHAHLDHIGRLPRLFNQGARPKIYSTEATRDIALIVLDDAHNIMLEESEECGLDTLYSEADLDAVMSSWNSKDYRDSFEVLDGVSVTMYDAGHILGSGFVLLEAEGKRVVFSGDVGSGTSIILNETEALPANLDLFVCESTYGDRLHDLKDARMKALQRYLVENKEKNGVLMVPAFSIERTQEILFEMNELVEFEGVDIGDVYLDSPLSITATRIFQKFGHRSDYMNFHTPEGFTDNNFFAFPGLTITDTVDASKRINDAPRPKVIVAGAGMMNAGRIQHHLVRYLDDPNNTLLITGYQANGTLGRRIQDGAQSAEILGYDVPVKAGVEKIESYSGHADYNKLVSWTKGSMPSRVVLTHGDAEAQASLASHLKHAGISDVVIPGFGETVEL